MFTETKLGLMLRKAKTELTLNRIWVEVFQDQELRRYVLNLIKYRQLFEKGVDETGEIIGTYSAFTERLNPEKKEGTPYTLFDTGDFYRSMFLIVTETELIIEADTLKQDAEGETTDLLEKYGDGILGLTEENKTELANKIIDKFNVVALRILSVD